MTIHTLEVRYIGNTKERKGGYRTSYGWIPGKEWFAIFPEDVLRQWFKMPADPAEAGSLYSVLGVDDSADPTELKSQYRRLARQWHPDINHEPDATQQFQAVQNAYEILSDTRTRAKYDAGLQLERKAGWTKHQDQGDMPRMLFRPPLRCGNLLVQAHEIWNGKKLNVDEILAWADIFDPEGNVLVTSWTWGDDTFTEMWIPNGAIT
jgi:hypothetical protein